MLDYIGNIHVILIHFPVALFLCAIISYVVSRLKIAKTLSITDNVSFWLAHRIMLLLGFIFTIPTVITGILHGIGWEGVNYHKFFGICLMIYSVLLYYLVDTNSKFYWVWLLILGILTIVTGHLGGMLTHGAIF